MKKIISVFLTYILVISCNHDDDNIKLHTEILGEYKFVSYTSNIPIDLDFDNNKDTNLLNEFDFFVNKSTRDAKVWEITYLHNFEFDYYVSLINFPRVNPNSIFFQNTLSQNQDAVFFNLANNVNVLDIQREMTDYPENGKYFYTTSVQFLPNKNMKITGIQKFYNYQTNNWIEVEIEAILEKK